MLIRLVKCGEDGESLNQPVLVNVDAIVSVSTLDGSVTEISTVDGKTILVKESVESIGLFTLKSIINPK